jgi:uncharacterized protein YbjT (DUF2867 family)
MSRHIFVTGGTGYVGSRLIPLLLGRGHQAIALARERSRHKLPPACNRVIGDALNGDTFSTAVQGADTFVHLVGVSHPSPAKARDFLEIDLKAALESIRVTRDTAVSHFVYLSVAHPAPVMKAYIDVRIKCEQAIADSGLNATILRPWYVLGPGHLWPYALIPFYKMAELVPRTRRAAVRLGLVTIREMVGALLYVTENPARGSRVWEPEDIRHLHAG